jgi:hypothetical protein
LPLTRPTVLNRLRLLWGWASYQAEHVYILVLEACMRLINRFDPDLYSEARRVRSIEEGGSDKPGGKYFVLLVFCNGRLPGFTRNMIDAIARSPFNLILVSNSGLTPALRAELLPKCRLLIERKNIGRDFGGYKDGVGIALRKFADIERLVIANDSVFFLDGLDGLIEAIDGRQDFIGLSEVYEHHYHVGSFMLSFGRRVIESRAFRQFWHRYKPMATRRWAIFKGEGALTATLLRAGFRPHVLYRASHLRPHLCGTQEEVALLPIEVRGIIAGTGDPTPTTTLHKFGVLVKWLGSTNRPERALKETIVDEIIARNQMHAAGYMFRKFLKMPMIKRDVFYRAVYSLEDLSDMVADQPAALRDEILADTKLRGNTADFGAYRKLLHRHA